MERKPTNQRWQWRCPAPNYMSRKRHQVRFARAKIPMRALRSLIRTTTPGKDYLRGVSKRWGRRDKVIADAASFEVADPTVDSQILTLATPRPTSFLIYSVTARACAQAIRRRRTGWRPMRLSPRAAPTRKR